MACGKPIIVYNSGSYREVDDGCVVKIDDIRSPQALMEAMEALAADEDLRTAIGDRALEYIKDAPPPPMLSAFSNSWLRKRRDNRTL